MSVSFQGQLKAAQLQRLSQLAGESFGHSGDMEAAADMQGRPGGRVRAWAALAAGLLIFGLLTALLSRAV